MTAGIATAQRSQLQCAEGPHADPTRMTCTFEQFSDEHFRSYGMVWYCQGSYSVLTAAHKCCYYECYKNILRPSLHLAPSANADSACRIAQPHHSRTEMSDIVSRAPSSALKQTAARLVDRCTGAGPHSLHLRASEAPGGEAHWFH